MSDEFSLKDAITKPAERAEDHILMGTSIQALDMNEMMTETNNVYYTVVVLSKRAAQIGAKLKNELNEKLAEFGTSSESLEEVTENREQIEIAKHYEELPKPTLLAIEEFRNDQVYYRNDSTPMVD